MKTSLSLTKSELEALIKLANLFIFFESVGSNLETHTHISALEQFVLQHGGKFVTGQVKPKNRLTLNDLQTLAFAQHINLHLYQMQHYEQALCRRIMEVIDKKLDSEIQLRKAIRRK